MCQRRPRDVRKGTKLPVFWGLRAFSSLGGSGVSQIGISKLCIRWPGASAGRGERNEGDAGQTGARRIRQPKGGLRPPQWSWRPRKPYACTRSMGDFPREDGAGGGKRPEGETGKRGIPWSRLGSPRCAAKLPHQPEELLDRERLPEEEQHPQPAPQARTLPSGRIPVMDSGGC